MAATNSWTLQKTPRRKRCCVSFLNQLSATLGQVEPRGAGRREVQLEARVGVQPLAHRLVLVGPVVVQDEIQYQVDV